jgi:Tol biopolymer transport system component
VISAPAGEKREKFETWRVNADGTSLTKLPISENDLVLDSSADGTWLATRTQSGESRHWGRLNLIHPGGTGIRMLTEGSASDDRFSIAKISPDSQRVACLEVKNVDDLRQYRLFIANIDGKNRREIPVAFEPGTTVGVCWSAVGSWLALDLHNQNRESTIAVVNQDGTNFRKVPLPPGRWSASVYHWKTLTEGCASDLSMARIEIRPGAASRH